MIEWYRNAQIVEVIALTIGHSHLPYGKTDHKSNQRKLKVGIIFDSLQF